MDQGGLFSCQYIWHSIGKELNYITIREFVYLLSRDVFKNPQSNFEWLSEVVITAVFAHFLSPLHYQQLFADETIADSSI